MSSAAYLVARAHSVYACFLQFAMMYVQALLLAACCFAPSVLGVIHNLEKHQEDELVQPLAIDISPDDDLGDIAEELFGTDFST